MGNEHRVALVTGASRGLGFEVAKLLARRYQLAITARHRDELAAASGIIGHNAEVFAIAGDVSDGAHAARLVSETLDRFGRIDALVNNASELGPSPMPALASLPLDHFDRILRVNVAAPLRLMQLVLPCMRAQGSGLIVNVSSDAGVEAYPNWGGYGASKAALEHLSRVFAREIEGSGIRVYVVDPGDMNTQMHRDAEPGVDLSHLPGPELVAPFIADLIERGTAAFGRFVAQPLAVAQ